MIEVLIPIPDSIYLLVCSVCLLIRLIFIALLAERCTFITMFGYSHDMLSVVSLQCECIMTR